MAFIKISGPPTITQDSDGNWTATLDYSDGINSYSYFSGPSIPDIYAAVQAALIDLAANYNQAALASDGLIPSITGS